MADPAENTRHVEDAAAALDSYQSRVISGQTVTHRQSPLLAMTLVRALINDLAHYADHAKIDIDDILKEIVEARAKPTFETPARDHPFRVGSDVELRRDTGPPDSAAHGRRGYVTAIQEPTKDGEPVYLVRFPGILAGEFHLTASALEPATTPFPTTTTRNAIIRSAALAEQTLIKVAARVQQARHTQQPLDLADLTDRALLAETLGRWTGTTGERVLLSITNKIERAAAQLNTPPPGNTTVSSPATLAKADFPHDINDGVPIAGDSAHGPKPAGNPERPRRRP